MIYFQAEIIKDPNNSTKTNSYPFRLFLYIDSSFKTPMKSMNFGAILPNENTSSVLSSLFILAQQIPSHMLRIRRT
jgi:hypothetical protein